MIRSAMAVLAGYLVMTVVVMVMFGLVTQLASGFAPQPGSVQPGFVRFNILFDLWAAFLGGLVAARVAERAKFQHALVLGAILLLLSVVDLVMNLGQRPLGIGPARVPLIAVAVSAGGWFGSRQKRPPQAEVLDLA